MSFPSSPVPSHYTTVSGGNTSHGIFYTGDTVSFSLDKSGATAYEVRAWNGVNEVDGSDPYGEVVSSGSVSGTTVTPAAPAGGWRNGWYRVYLTGTVSDAVFGTSYGAWSFVVIRDNAAFPRWATSDDITSGNALSDDATTKAILGMGVNRLFVGDASLCDRDYPYTPGYFPGNTYTGPSLWAAKLKAEAYSAKAPVDPARHFYQFLQFPNGSGDSVGLAADDSADGWLAVYPLTTSIAPEDLFIEVTAGSVSGTKLNVYYPESVLVESFDNLGDGEASAATVNASSAYVKTFARSGTVGTDRAPTAIGNAFRLGVIEAVNYMWDYGVTHFEGPINEGPYNEELAHASMMFCDNVKRGNPNAVTMGPALVSISNFSGWETFLLAGGADHFDEISTHMYNSQTAGDINQGRQQIRKWLDLLEKYGQHEKKLWSTESTHMILAAYGSFHPRHARVPLLQTMVLEQMGIPRERNLLWYDLSHGFWAYPSWWENNDGSLMPYAALYRTMAEETLGRQFDRPIDFGSVQANSIFIGNVYKGDDGTQVVCLVSQSYLPSGEVRLALVGSTDDVEWCDSWGNEGTAGVSSGMISIPVSDIPVYVRLPAGVNVTVDSVAPGGNHWGSVAPSVCGYARTQLGDGSSSPVVIDNSYPSTYPSSGLYTSESSFPDTLDVLFNSTIDVDRVTIVCAPPWQVYGSLVDFDISTTHDGGGSWTHRESYSLDPLSDSTISHVTSYVNVGCEWESWWPKQFVFDVTLPSSVAANGVRVTVNNASYGGEPISDISLGGSGQGSDVETYSLQEIIVPSASSPTPFTEAYRDLVVGTEGILGYWRLGEADGETVAASEVNAPAYDGTYVTSSGTGGPASVDGVINDGDKAKSFLGLGSLTLPDIDFGDTFTIEFWHNVSGDDFSGLDIFVKGFTPSSPDIRWLEGEIRLTKGSTLVAHASTTYTDSKWHHVVVTNDSVSGPLIYIDGIECTVVDSSATFTSNNSTASVSGRQLDEFALYSVALTAEQVTDHYSASSTPAAIPVLEPLYQSPGPVVFGDAVVGSQVQTTPGVWRGGPNRFSYQWQSSSDNSSWSDVAGSTRSDFIIDTGDLGLYLRCGVTPANVVGAGSVAFSDSVGPVNVFQSGGGGSSSGVVLLSGVKSTTSDASDDVRDVDKGWSIY